MDLIRINDVVDQYSVSSRTLRYYDAYVKYKTKKLSNISALLLLSKNKRPSLIKVMGV